MQTVDLIHEIKRLTLSQRFVVVEEIINSIKKEEINRQMELAAIELIKDYENDKELTAFTSVDFDNFYEISTTGSTSTKEHE